VAAHSSPRASSSNSRDHTFSPRELAAIVGVSESSMKRWIDAGEVEAGRTAGGHRRVSRREAVRFIRERELPVADLSALQLPDLAGVPDARRAGPLRAEEITEALRAGDARHVRALVVAEYVRGAPVAALCDGPLRQALHHMGTLWREGRSGIGVEHEATDTFTQALNQIRSLVPPPPPGAPVAVGGAIAGDPYAIPSLMAATVLEDLGFEVTNLGPNTPTGVLADVARERGAALVWLSVTALSSDDELRGAGRELAEGLEGTGARIIIGGQRAEQSALPELDVLPSMQALASAAEQVLAARGMGE
jgi:excisionase family DNA binding protein